MATEVLVVEDDALDRALLVELLTLRGRGRLRVSEAASFTTAVERLADRTYDLVLLDTRLPDVTALHAIRSIGEQAPLTAVLPHSAFITARARQTARERGAYDVVVRGELNPLWSAVSKLLALGAVGREPPPIARAAGE